MDLGDAISELEKFVWNLVSQVMMPTQLKCLIVSYCMKQNNSFHFAMGLYSYLR